MQPIPLPIYWGTHCFIAATTGPPDIFQSWVKTDEVFVSVLAPASPYTDEDTGKPYRLDNSYELGFEYRYRAYLYSKSPSGNIKVGLCCLYGF